MRTSTQVRGGPREWRRTCACRPRPRRCGGRRCAPEPRTARAPAGRVGPDRFAVLVEEAQADVTDRALVAQHLLVLGGHRVPALLEQRRRLQTADPDQQQGEPGPGVHHLADDRVLHQGSLRAHAPDQSGHRQQDWRRAGQVRQPADQPRRSCLGGRIADTAEHLHDLLGDLGRPGRHRLDRRQQGGAPGRDADPVTAGERRLQIHRRGCAQCRDDVCVVLTAGVDHDHLAHAVPLLDRDPPARCGRRSAG